MMNRARERAGAGPAEGCRPEGEGGFALLVALLTLVGLTALASAGFVLSETENDVSQNQLAAAYADQAANAGLFEYLGTHGAATDTATYTYPHGSATVFGERLLDLGNGHVLYRITASGSYSAGTGGVAARTVGAAAIYSSGTITATAGVTSGGGFHKNGAAGLLSGSDGATSAECPGAPRPAVAGLAVPQDGFEQSGSGGPVEKSKKKVEELVGGETCDGCEGDPPLDESGTPEEQLAKTGVDWESVVNGGTRADYTIPPDSWPNFSQLGEDAWPVIYVEDASYAVNAEQSGRGTLIVRGNLTMNGSFRWDGLVLIGGSLTSNGNNTVEGATIAGLNILLGESVTDSDIGNGQKRFQYHSCNLYWAKEAAFGGMAVLPGSWFESM